MKHVKHLIAPAQFAQNSIPPTALLPAATRSAKEKDTGKKPGGKPPKAPEPVPKESGQINLTAGESRIMPVSGGGFEQAYTAQAAVDAATMPAIASGVTQAPNDKEQVEPMLETLKTQSLRFGAVACLIADTGFPSEKNIRHVRRRISSHSSRWHGTDTIRAGGSATASRPLCPTMPRRCKPWRIV